jgi:hypothetical protein
MMAEKIESFCRKHVNKDFIIEGANTDTTDKTEAYITYSNAAIIGYIAERGGDEYVFTKPVKEIFEVPLNILKIIKGEEVKNPRYRMFKAMYKRGKIDKDLLDEDIASAYSLVRWSLRDRVDLVKLSETVRHNPNATTCVATAHSIKGAEFGTVTICPSLNSYVTNKLVTKGISEEEKLEAAKLYYVATSRCKHTLYNAELL